MTDELVAVGFDWWLEFFKFILAVGVAFYIPGSFFLTSKTRLNFLVRATLSVLIGLVLWGWQEFIFGYLSLRNLSHAYLTVFLLIWLLKNRRKITGFSLFAQLNRLWTIGKTNWLLVLIIFLGVLSQTFSLWHNGVFTKNNDLVFAGGNIEDNLWHASLTDQIVKHFPPLAPGFPGVLIKNYHYWSNLVIGSLVRVFKLPLFPAQFHFFPLLVALLLGASALSLAEVINLNQKTTRFFVFFNYFGGDLIYLIQIIFKQGSKIFSMSSLEDGTKFLYNPPRAFSWIIALGGLTLLALWQKEKKHFFGFLSMFLLASTIGFKIYTGLFFAGGIALLALISFLKQEWKKLSVYLSFYLFAALIYLPTNTEAGGLTWLPFSVVNNFIVQPDLGLRRWELARVIFFEDKKYLHNLFFEINFTALFLAGVLGTKIIGFLQSPFFVIKKLGRDLFLILLTGIITSLTAGLFFIQTTGGANTFNFLVSVFLSLSLLAGLSLGYWQSKIPRKLFLLLTIFIIAFTLPRFFYESANNLKNFMKPKGFLINREERQLFEVINERSEPTDKIAVEPGHYIGHVSPYLSLFIDRPLMVSGGGLLKHFRLGVDGAVDEQKVMFETTNEKELLDRLIENDIKYVFLYEYHELKATESASFTSLAAKNSAGSVLILDREKMIRRYWELETQGFKKRR